MRDSGYVLSALHSSPKTNKEKGLKMDTSNSTLVSPAEFILGKRRFKQETLSQEDWVAILNKTLEQIKPRLKYLSGFVNVTTHGMKTMSNCGVSVWSVISGPPGGPDLDFTTRCATVIHGLTAGPRIPAEFKQPPNEYESDLLMTQSGKLFAWNAGLELWNPENPSLNHNYLLRYLEISPVNLAHLPLTDIQSRFYRAKLGQDRMSLGYAIMEGLHTLLNQTIAKRQNFIDEMKAASFCIESMKDCIEL